MLAIEKWRLRDIGRFDSLCCVSRWLHRNRFELYARTLLQRLPRLIIPLTEGGPDVMLDVQAALEQVSTEGRYARRIRYDEKCRPRLPAEDQAWADEQIAAFRAEREEESTGGGD